MLDFGRNGDLSRGVKTETSFGKLFVYPPVKLFMYMTSKMTPLECSRVSILGPNIFRAFLPFFDDFRIFGRFGDIFGTDGV